MYTVIDSREFIVILKQIIMLKAKQLFDLLEIVGEKLTDKKDQIIYSLGAMTGGLSGLFITSFIL
jgi:hypothetical protein